MNGPRESHPPRPRIDAAAKAVFLAGLARGARREDAAAAAGFSLTGFYGVRTRDPAFRAGWADALAGPSAAERRTRAYAARDGGDDCGEERIAAANRRLVQRRRRRHVRFTEARQAAYLAYFALTCDTKAAAAVAGVSPSTVTLHRRANPEFAALHREALAQGYVALEAEALRQRLAAQARLRAALARAGADNPAPRAPCCPECGQPLDSGAEFDRTLRLLDSLDRKARRAERNFRPGGRRKEWTFEQAILALDRKLTALGVREGVAVAGEKVDGGHRLENGDITGECPSGTGC